MNRHARSDSVLGVASVAIAGAMPGSGQTPIQVPNITTTQVGMRKGRRRLAGLLVGLCVVAALALGGDCLREALQSAQRPFPGFLLYPSGAVAPLMRRSWTSATLRLGPGETVRTINGRPLARPTDIHAELAKYDVGTSLDLEFGRKDGTQQRGTVRLRRLSPADFGFVFALPFGIGMLYLALGTVVFFVKRTSPALLVFALCLIAAVFYLTMFDAHFTYRYSRIWISYPLLGAVSVHLFSLFPERRPGFARFALLGPFYGIAALLVALRQAHLFQTQSFDRTSFASGLFLAFSFLVDLGLLRATWTRTTSPATRSKARSVAFGLVVSITLSLVWAFASRLGPVHVTADQAMILSAVFPILIGYAVLRRNLFDLDAVLQKSLIYGVVTVVLLGIYFLAVALTSGFASTFASKWAPFGTPLGRTIVVTAVIALATRPLHTQAKRAVTRLFFSETVSIRDALLALAKDLERATSPPELGELVATRLQKVLHLEGASLLMFDARAERWTVLGTSGEIAPPAGDSAELARLSSSAERVDVRGTATPAAGTVTNGEATESTAEQTNAGVVLIPLSGKGGLSGAFALASHRDGSDLSAADLDLLQALAPAAAMAVENAMLLAERGSRERLATLGGVAAVIVHEIKNPIGIIRVSASALAKKFPQGDSGKELAGCIVEEVDRMDGTLRQLLSFAKPQPPALATCNLSQLVLRTTDRMRPQLDNVGVRVATDLAADVEVTADPLQLERVLVNLIQNAMAATAPETSWAGAGSGPDDRPDPRDDAEAEQAPNGHIVTVSTRSVPRPFGGKAVELSVADTGTGMNEETQKNLFNPFFTTRPGGNGLGLAIVKQILDEHRATISVESEPGHGSVFRITLPA